MISFFFIQLCLSLDKVENTFYSCPICTIFNIQCKYYLTADRLQAMIEANA